MKEKKAKQFEPNHYKREGFASKQAVVHLNMVLDPNIPPEQRKICISNFINEQLLHGDAPPRRSRAPTPTVNPDGHNIPCLPTWLWSDPDAPPLATESCDATTAWARVKDGSIPLTASGTAAPSLQYPISSELLHIKLPVGKDSSVPIEGLLDTGGACTMGDLTYWLEVANKVPHIVASLDELSVYQEKPITIGGVGAGKVEITHVLALWLPGLFNGSPCKLVIGLGENMPVTLLIGLPFQIATQCVIDVANLRCHSSVFGMTWPLSMKMPFKKCLRSLDTSIASLSSSKRLALPLVPVSPSPAKKVKWDGSQAMEIGE